MRIRSVHVRNFRSIESASLSDCGGLNVLIGKNNAGKSNFLKAIEIVLDHLRLGSVARDWPADRPIDEYTDRNTKRLLQIGVQFELPSAVMAGLLKMLRDELPHFERAIDDIKPASYLNIVISGHFDSILNKSFLYLQRAGFGDFSNDKDLTISGTNLLQVPDDVAAQLYDINTGLTELRQDIETLQSASQRLSDRELEQGSMRFYLGQAAQNFASAARVDRMLGTAKGSAEMKQRMQSLTSELRDKLESLQQKQTEGSLIAFAGATKTLPKYMGWLIEQCGTLKLLHLRETKQPIGREEAAALLQLKVKRGGPERLRLVQETVQTLLGVEVDAFEPESSSRRERIAEMDIDNFLVEANGAGIREALRLILDVELKMPSLVLLEEPEVHLHPGLARAVESYLRAKSSDIQLFVTTHSTDFVDSSSLQNVYLIGRNGQAKSTAQKIQGVDHLLNIPRELGLRLSTVFMFDRLIFVEGSTDEDVFKQFARTLQINFAKANVGFVQMGGIRNFGHFAADKTLELLSKRQIRVWFITDRDERDDEEIKTLQQRIGSQAKLLSLHKRELENYLLDPACVANFIADKRRLAGIAASNPSITEVGEAIREEASKLRDEVLARRVAHKLLKPVHLRGKDNSTDANLCLNEGLKLLQQRIEALETERKQIGEELTATWANNALNLAPGDMVLDNVAKRFSVRFRKENGDSVRLAALMTSDDIPHEISSILKQVVE